MPFDLGVIARKPLQAPLGQLIATGGTEYFAEDGGIIYRVHEFTSSDEFVVGNLSGTVECFILAGGGGGGSATTGARRGGGGGAGGLLIVQNILVRAGVSYSVVVGAGLAGDGGNSSAFGFVAVGGGRGGSATTVDQRPGQNGGSGGGAGTLSPATTDAQGGQGVAGPPRQGNNGGGLGGVLDGLSGAGGGGYSTVGGNAIPSGPGAPGGDGIISTFNGSPRAYAGGGAGGASTTNSIGGVATPNRGAGGRGATPNILSVQGSSGIVYIRYPFGFTATGGTVTDVIEDEIYYRVHTLTESDTATFSGTGTIELLMVAGGGGGGIDSGTSDEAGGGGAGGLIYKETLPVRADVNYPIIIGAAGAISENGSNTTAFNLTAIGGGAGGNWKNVASNLVPDDFPTAGGSGGGGGRVSADQRIPGAGLQPTSASGGFGNPGGQGLTVRAGGGGGAGGAGAQGSSDGALGGEGLSFNIDGTSRIYANGGPGGVNGTSYPIMQQHVQALYGGGGKPDGQGTQGVVIFRYVYFPEGQAEYTTPGTYSWTAPEGVTLVCAVCVGGGAGGGYGSGSGGGGGALGWKNFIDVISGQSYTVVVGAGGAAKVVNTATIGNIGESSYFINETTVFAEGGKTASGTTPIAATFVGEGGGNGGRGAYSSGGGGGGGAGGYAGNGGNGGASSSSGQAGSGGAGGGGGGSRNVSGGNEIAGGGGGVGIYGQGANGAGGAGTSGTNAGPGQGGSNGADGVGRNAGLYGGGGASVRPASSGGTLTTGAGRSGAVRIIWGLGRSFPDNAADI